MAVGRAALIVSATLTAPTFFIDSAPLESNGPPTEAERNQNWAYTDLGVAGLRIYRGRCSACHGRFGEGSPVAPGLQDYQQRWDSAMQVRFHAFAADFSHFDPKASGRGGDLNFNSVELMGRYLREARRNPG
ncbi:MAG: c-type cytochrome [Pseudomonadota bacterium]